MNFYNVIQTIMYLIGGIGIFLLGLQFLSSGLQTIAGPTLQKLISKVTSNSLLGIFVGASVTCLVQSSALTMAMIIGFVNAGIMILPQTLGVIMGTNIGTTITGWVLVLNVDQYGIPIAGLFALVYCFVKKEYIKYLALALLGVGLVFVGLYAMKNSITPIANDPAFLNTLAIFNVRGFASLFMCILVGFLLAAIMQSSSASLGVTIVLASQGLIGFETAAALVLGQNIGCTISALMIAMNASKQAKRAAFFHLFFNIFGVIWVTVLFNPVISFMDFIVTQIFNKQDINAKETLPFAIALFHTCFNVANTIVVLPFTSKILCVLEKLFHRKIIAKKTLVTRLNISFIKSPFVAIAQSSKEMRLMSVSVQKMLSDLRHCLEKTEDSKECAEHIFNEEKRLDRVQTEVIDFLTQLLLMPNISKLVANDAKYQLRMSDDLETASDYVTQILKLQLRMNEKNVSFSAFHLKRMLELHDMVFTLANKFSDFLSDKDNAKKLSEIRNLGIAVTQKMRELRSELWENLTEYHVDPLVITSFTDMLNAYRKLKEYLVSSLK